LHACRAIHRTDIAFWLSAVQSAVFNRALDDRLSSGTFDQLLEGDLAWRHDRRHVFAVTAAELDNPELAPRVESLEVSPTGPLWGPGMTRAAGRVDEAELAAIAALGIDATVLLKPRTDFEGARRPFRARLRNHEIDSGLDEHGPYIRVAFDLDRGAYATIALREIMKAQTDAVQERREDE
jgi:tRNA pseudouridine13 synthase